MTLEELKKLRFRMQSHVAMEDEHIASYVNDDYGFIMQVITKKKNEFKFGRSKRHFHQLLCSSHLNSQTQRSRNQ